MTVITLGLDHTTAPLDLRGRFAISPDRLVPSLRAFREHLRQTAEVAIVSTCNRTELYLGAGTGGDPEALADHAFGWLAATGRVSRAELEAHTFRHDDVDAARHTFRLASGLSSMVVGETQILGQMKQAVRGADDAGTPGSTLHQLFQRSFSVAKEVRSGTEIGMHTISLAAAISRLAGQLFEDFESLHVLVLGAGDMAAPVVAHLAAKAPRSITIANRSRARGDAMAAHFGAASLGIAEALERLADYDVIVCATASPQSLIDSARVAQAVHARKRRPMLMVDLAVPRDIDPSVANLPDVYLHTIDDLALLVKAGSDKRSAAIGQADVIIEAGVQDFRRWLATRGTVPLIQALQQQAESWRSSELQRARKQIGRGDDVDAVLEALSRSLTQKMLYGPMAGLQAAEGAERIALTDTLSKLFLSCPMRSSR